MRKSELVQLIYAAVPKSNLIEDLDLESDEKAVTFKWWGAEYYVDSGLIVNEKRDDVWTGETDKARLMNALIYKQVALNATVKPEGEK